MPVDYLECDHCGCEAFASDARGYFTDGDGGACMTCGFPGSVCSDAETPPYWLTSDYAEARCADPTCSDCA